MAAQQLNHVVRHIHRVVPAADADITDAELLRRFVAHRDEAAFATLVQRYGPLVLGVCQRVLHHRQDAEDAFQATFLVLLHKAGSISQPELVGNWLYGVAHFTAKNARLSAARRRARERQVTEMAPTHDAAGEEVWRELRPLLDEELSRLPEKYRVPIVLCELHGKSRKEVALLLDCPEGTVSSRLARGRELLRTRLARRGVTLSAAGLAGALSRDAVSAAVPPPLATATVAAVMRVAANTGAAAGVLPHQVAALTDGVLKTMFLAKLKMTTAFLLALAVLTGAGVLAHRALADRPAPPAAAAPLDDDTSPLPIAQKKPEPAKAEEPRETLSVAGRVLGPDGQPVPGARLYLPRSTKNQGRGAEEVAVTQRGSSGKDGRFRVKLPRPDARPDRPAMLIAAADGFGVDSVELPHKGELGEVTFHLTRDVPIRGRILSTEGKPVVGATVTVIGLMVPDKLDEFLQALRREWRAAETMMSKQLNLPLTEVLRVTRSDRDGRFEVKGAGADRLIGLEVTHPGMAQGRLLVITHEGFDAKAANQAMAQRERGIGQLYGPSFEYVAEPARALEGVIREAGTGKPVAGATVQVTANTAVQAATSDAQGRYRILGLRKAPQYTLNVTAPSDAPLMGRWVKVADAVGLEAIHTDVELVRGVVITGRVYNKATGQSVKSQVHFAPLPENKFAAKSAAENTAYAFSEDDGRFHLVTVPGPGVLLAQALGTRPTINGVRVHPYPLNIYKLAEFSADDLKRVKVNSEGLRAFAVVGGSLESLDMYNVCKVLDVKEDGGATRCDLAVDPGKDITVRLLDPQGQPLAGVIAAGVVAAPLNALSLKSADCPVYALDPERPRRLLFLHRERQLGGVLTLRGDEKVPVAFTLTPSAVVTGRLLDTDGRPLADAQVAVRYAGPAGNALAREVMRRYDLPRAGADGRFRLEGMLPGLEFDLGFLKGRQTLVPEARLKVKPPETGETLDLGDIRTKPRRP
jgi:RNA polymerase sigma factor (sigma-70 family)